MKERPVLFKGEMVKAILEDRKTQTRRLNGLKAINQSPDRWVFSWFSEDLGYPASKGHLWAGFSHIASQSSRIYFKCPYGQVGDRLWVRETWRINAKGAVSYKADEGDSWIGRWNPSIHMFRNDSRITLEITGISVERVQDITGKEVISEGVQYPVSSTGSALLEISSRYAPGNYLLGKFKGGKYSGNEEDWLKAHFASLWDSINGKTYPWASSPWVWVVNFKRVTA